ncbi:MAG: DMT family transporter [Peptostreptococcaceae bacterium]|nr:DMT family transporter [Peptostreptococcaceae bacterium]
MNKQLKADLMLLLVVACWGISFYMIDLSLKEMGPFSLLAFRFVLSFLVVYVFFFKKVRTVNKKTLGYALTTSVFLAIAYTASVYGVLYTKLTNAAFLCALTVIFAPIFSFIFKKKRPNSKFVFVLILCIVGMGLLTLSDELTIAVGDLYCLVCAMSFSINLLIIETAVSKEDVDAFNMGVYVIGIVGLIMLVCAFLFEEPTLPQTPAVWGAALFLSILCTGVATIVQAIAQQYTSASHVGLIYTLEPVFAAIIAYLLAGEVLLVRGYIGASMMVLSILIMEIDFKKMVSKPKPSAD